jgi:hypothetical protein
MMELRSVGHHFVSAKQWSAACDARPVVTRARMGMYAPIMVPRRGPVPTVRRMMSAEPRHSLHVTDNRACQHRR